MATKKSTEATAKKKAAPKKRATKKSKKEEVEVVDVIIDGNDPKAEETSLETKSFGNFKDQTPVSGNGEVTEKPVSNDPNIESEEDIKKQEEERANLLEILKRFDPKYDFEETAKDFGDRLQKQAEEQKKDLSNINSEDDLKEKEDEIVKLLDEYDKYIKDRVYKLPKSVDFDGRNYPRDQIGNKIVRILDKKEVQWQYTLGLYQLSKVWAAAKFLEELPYEVYDSTLRVLGDIQYKGFSEWKDILAINEFFTLTNKDYAKDSTLLIYLSTLHSNILERIQLVTPIKNTEENSEEESK